MRLGLDLESSGKLRKGVPLDDASQPRICQMAAILFDMQWKPVGKFVSLIRPDGWSIEPEAQAIHRITEADCARSGVSIVVALLALKDLAANALQVFAHSAPFERDMIQSELHRLKADGLWWRKKGSSMVCTMQASTEICAIPNPSYPGFKWPSLEEAMAHFYPERIGHKTRHEAEADVMDAALVAQGLQREGLWPDFFVAGWKGKAS